MSETALALLLVWMRSTRRRRAKAREMEAYVSKKEKSLSLRNRNVDRSTTSKVPHDVVSASIGVFVFVCVDRLSDALLGITDPRRR